VPGPTQQLYICGAPMVSFYPVSIPYHGMALNMTVQSYAGKVLEFGITCCRRNLSQDESHELIGYLKDALQEIEQLPSVGEAGPPVDAPATLPAKAAGKATSRQSTARKPPAGKGGGRPSRAAAG
jgi:diacylglycerol O-acyltransferase